MKILVLTSRYTATRDIIAEDFGRQTRLFEALKKFKHDIDFFCVDYKKKENKNVKLHGINVFIRPFGIFYFFSFLKNLNSLLKKKKYDVFIATSDPLWGLVGYILAKKHKIRFIYDLQDNYEVYTTYKIPFFEYIDHYVMRHSDIITTVSFTLKNKIRKIRNKKVFVIQNGVDTKLFRPMNKIECRKALKLPHKNDAKIIVYAGSIHRYEGADRLVRMFELLKKDISNCYLAIAGRYTKGEEKYINLNRKNLIYFGSLSQDKVVKLINAGDVSVVPYTNNNQVTYGFPYKLVEYMACNTKIIATKVGDVKNIVPKNDLCNPDSVKALAKKVVEKLNSTKKINYRKTAEKYTWDAIAKKLDKIIRNN